MKVALLGALICCTCDGREDNKPLVDGGPFAYTEEGAEFHGYGYFLIALNEPAFAVEVSLLNRAGFRVAFGQEEWRLFLSGASLATGYDGSPLYVDLDTTAEVVLLDRTPFRMGMTLRRIDGSEVVSSEALLEGPMEAAVCFDSSARDGVSPKCSDLYAVAEMETFGATLLVEYE